MADDILDRVRAFAARGEDGEAGTPDDPAPDAATEGADEMAKTDVQSAVGEDIPASETAASNGSSGRWPLGAAGAVRPCPLPAGAVIFGELTSAFVDGPRLVRFLGDRKHTGAVVDSARGGSQAAVLHEGAVVALVSVNDSGTRRLESLSLPGPSGDDEHALTVMTYRPEVALALAQLVNLPERFERMHGSFVDLPALLQFLRREKANGAVRVTTRDDTGVILLRGGEVLGAYTRVRPDLDDADVVFPLAKQPEAEIDVHVAALVIPPASVPAATVVGG